MSLAAIHWLEEARTRSAAQDCPRLYPHWVRLCRRPQSLSALHPSCPCSEYGWTGFQSLARRCSMQVGLRLANISYEGQKVVELKYKDHYVGEGYPDLVVHLCDEKLIVELKAICGELGASEEQQLRNYMTILNVKRGMLINFQQPGRKQGKTKLDIREIAL